MRFTIYDLRFTIGKQLSRVALLTPLFSVYCLLFTVVLLLLLISMGYWRATATGPQVQVPMFYDAHYLFPRPWTQEQQAPGVPDPFPVSAVFGPNQVSQSFIAGADSLAMVEVWLAGPDGMMVELSLTGKEFTSSGEVILTQGPMGRWYRFTFPPIKNSRNQPYTIKLAAPTATQELPVTTWVVGGDRLGGSVHLNEYPRPGNLVLRTYSRGWLGEWWLQAIGEQLLPGVFRLRLQQYKPPLFKGSTFSILLGLTAVLTLIFLVFSPRPFPFAFHTLTWAMTGLFGVFLIWQAGFGRLQVPFSAVRLVPVSTIRSMNLTDQDFRVINDLVGTLWTAERLPEPRFVGTPWKGWATIYVPTESTLNYPMTMPLNGRFRVGIVTVGEGELRFVVRFGRQELASRTLLQTNTITWLEVDLAAWAGQSGTLSLVTESVSKTPTGGQWIQPQILAKSDWLLPDPLPADSSIQSTSYRFSETAELVGYTTRIHDGLLEVTLYWRILQRTAESPTIFIHVLDESGQIVAQQDSLPVSGTYPMPLWPPGVIVQDRHTIPFSPPNGRFTLALGLYNPDNFMRWLVTDTNGTLQPDNRVILERPLEIGE